MTNEQAVVNARKEIAALKGKYVNYITPIVIKYNEGGVEPTLTELLECQRLGNAYFNFVERFVGDSGLLGAHENGKWVTGFAEDCREILESYLIHHDFISSWVSVLGEASKPSITAYANMQRMVKEYLQPEQVDDLRNEFVEKSLSTHGFDMEAAPDKYKVPKWQLITSVAIGVISLISSVIIALALPNPTIYQVFILRGLFAISLASIASIIPGFLNLNVGAGGAKAYFAIYAGGAIAIFVLIWLFNPPDIENTNKPVSVEVAK